MDTRWSILHSSHVQKPSFEINLVPSQCAQLRHAKSVSVCYEDHRRVTVPVSTALACAVHELRDFLDSQILAWSALGVLDSSRWYCPIISGWYRPALRMFGLGNSCGRFHNCPEKKQN